MFDAQSDMNANPLSGFVQGFGNSFNQSIADEMERVKKQQDEKRRQENVKQSISQFQQMATQMQEMGDNSNVGKVNKTIGDDVSKTRRGIVGVKSLLPQQEMTIDENGALNFKMGFKQASPTEQKAQVEMQAKQIELEKQAAKADLLSGFIKGQQSEGALMMSAPELGITSEDIDFAYDAKQRINQPQQIMAEAQSIPQQAPQYQPFSAARRKELRETQEADKANQIRKDASIDAASTSLNAIDHLLKNINYFGAIEGRMPAGLNTGKREWAKNFDFLESKNVLNVLGEMKSQSRTGATGFGALNEKELAIIKNASMRLDKQLDEKTAAKYLNEMKASFQKIIDREQNGYESEKSGQVQPQPTAQPTITREQAIAELKRRGKL